MYKFNSPVRVLGANRLSQAEANSLATAIRQLISEGQKQSK